MNNGFNKAIADRLSKSERLNTYNLAEVAEVVDCEHKTAPKVDTSEYCSIRTTDIFNGRIDINNANRVSEETYLEWIKRAKPEPGDIILAREAPVGEVGLIKEGYKVCLGQRTVLIKVNHSEVSNRYLLYYLTNSDTKYELQVCSAGSVVSHLNMKDIRDFKLTLPSLPEQKVIAAVLSSLDDKIDLLHRQNQTLEAMAETLFRQWFIEEAQEDWEEIPFANYAEHLKVNIKPADNSLCEYTHYSLPAFDAGMRPVLENGSEILSNKYGVEPWTILVSKLNPRFPRIWPIGEIPGQNAICSTEFQVFKPRNEKLYGFLYFFLKSTGAKEELAMAASGTSGSHQRVRPEDILNLKIIISSTDNAENFSELVMSGIKKSMVNLQQIQALEKLRDTLLPKLMSGEVRIRL